MFDLTSAQYRFRTALAEGDLYQALGLARSASNLDVDVAGARLAERAPGMAQEVSKVVNVLSHRRRRMVYDAVRRLCDDVMAAFAARQGIEFGNSFSDYRRDLWQRCCRLFRFDLSRGGTAIGPRGVESLVRNGQTWIRHEFLQARVPVIAFTARELNRGRTTRDLWHTRCTCGDRGRTFYRLHRTGPAEPDNDAEGRQPPDAFRAEDYESSEIRCDRCWASWVAPQRFEERYDFSLSPQLTRGDVVRGEGVFSGRTIFVIVNERPGTSTPRDLLDRFFQLQEDGRDVTIEEVKLALENEQATSRERATAQQRSIWTRHFEFPSFIRAGYLVFLFIGAIAVVANRAPQHHRHSSPYQQPVPRWRPEPLNLPTVSPTSSYDAIRETLQRMEHQKRKERIEKWLRGGERDPAVTDQILKELERQKAKHGCPDNPCAGFRQLQAAIDAINRGEPVIGWIEDGKLHIEVVATFPFEENSPLGRWLCEDGTKDAVPSDIIKKELEHQKEKHDCKDNPCSDICRLQAIVEAIDRGDIVTGHIEKDQLHIELGAKTSHPPEPNQPASSDFTDGQANRP